jgi:RNA polymerase sigma-70 factor (ECF subfamily)
MNLEEHALAVDRKKVWAACYRVTGCAADADEVLQEAFARALETRPNVSDEQPLEPWIMKVAVRLAIDRLRRRRETPYDGPWLPSPIATDDTASEPPSARYEMIESATFAFLLALEALTPSQRAVLVLRDVLDMSAAETAKLTGETEQNVRALHHRARAKLASYDRDRVRPDGAARERARAVLETLFGYFATGNATAALGLLADSARLVNDAGGVYHAARKIVRGPDRIVRFYEGLIRKLGMPERVAVRELAGLPAIEMFYPRTPGRFAPHLVTGVMLDARGRVETVYTVLAPRKLVHLVG